MKDENYIVIQGWMINKLNLKGNELLAYALIYGFSQNNDCEYTGSLNYISNALSCSKSTVSLVLKKLVEKGLIIKRTEFINDVAFCRYKSAGCTENRNEGVPKIGRGCTENRKGGVPKIGTNNNINNTNNTNNKYTEDFEKFFDSYHTICNIPRTDKEAAFKHWRKLNESEKRLAIEKIKAYYNSVQNKQYLKKSRTYLSDKNFNDEFGNNSSNNNVKLKAPKNDFKGY